MQASELYKSIYRFWGDTTPLDCDCGALCGKACCDGGDEEETGMYLFPGEKPLFLHHPNYRVLSSEFIYGEKNGDIVICNGPCARETRPLSCRIFPLIPYYRRETGLKILRDPRAAQLCPLASKAAFPHLNRSFVCKTEAVFRLLVQFSEVRLYLEGLSDILDDYLKFVPKGGILT